MSLEREITWIGAARGCDYWLPANDAASIQAVFVKTPERLFVISLGSPGTTRVNGRAVECAVLDAGDLLSMGSQMARLTVHWATSSESGALLKAESPNESTFTIAWQNYLQQQTAHMHELQRLQQRTASTVAESAQLAALQQLLATQLPAQTPSS